MDKYISQEDTSLKTALQLHCPLLWLAAFYLTSVLTDQLQMFPGEKQGERKTICQDCQGRKACVFITFLLL